MSKRRKAALAPSVHQDGPGLRVIPSNQLWYGPGYCAICGDRTYVDADHPRGVVPEAVRYWDPDDGWKMGVLCVGCGEECTDRGPKPDDFAMQIGGHDETEGHADRIDLMAHFTDLDSAYADRMD